MTKNPFLKTVFEALEDEIDIVDFEKASRDYSVKTQKVNQIMKILEVITGNGGNQNRTRQCPQTYQRT